MTAAHAHLRAKLDRATQRLIQLQTQEALAQLRRKTRERTRDRRDQARRRYELGDAVAAAGLGDWSKAELSGLLVRAKEHFGDSEMTRRMMAHHASPDGLSSPTVH